ncbi:MAG TPA: type II secretion system protein [Chthoniobacteraceae bacterium]|nr:type II secretion system protein [Chthoniobacteraceae bacterium]
MKLPLSPLNIRSVPDRHGFTWIELLVVLAIAGVLIALLSGAAGKMLNGRKVVKEIANFRTIGTALHSYLAEHQQVMPTMNTSKRILAYHIGLLETVSDWNLLAKSGTNAAAVESLFISAYDDRPVPSRWDSYAKNHYMGDDMKEQVDFETVGVLRYNEIVHPSQKLYYIPAYFLRKYQPSFSAASVNSPFMDPPHHAGYKGAFPGLFVDGHVEMVDPDPARVGTTAYLIRIRMIMPRR